MYDIIGDIHGHYHLLIKMLEKLGYEKSNDTYIHPERKLIFTGDFINRGPKIRQTVRLIRAMVDSQNAYTVLGNHELNAILYATIDSSGKTLRKRLPQYKLPLLKTLEAYKKHESEFIDTIKWFRHLPVYIDLGQIRIVHGAWNSQHIATVDKYKGRSNRLKRSFLRKYLENDELKNALNVLLKGEEMILPKDLLVKDDAGIIRRNFRIKWWKTLENCTFNEAAFGNRFELPHYTIPHQLTPKIEAYPHNAPPVFLGHYCLEKKPFIYNKGNVCCIDSCITRTGKLACYRWNGENVLSNKNVVIV